MVRGSFCSIGRGVLVWVILVVASSVSDGADSFPFPTPAGHLRLATWNLEFFNNRDPVRTTQQLDLLAQRMIGLDASVVMLQEINQFAALEDLRTRMGGDWQLFGGNLLGIVPQQNAILYDASRVEVNSAEFVYALDDWFYPEAIYRTPVSAVFSPIGQPDEAFRVLTFHGHWNSVSQRDEEGYWLAEYVNRLMSDPVETDRILVLGDFNGAPGAAPHLGLASGGELTLVPKRNGEETTVYVGYQLDHVYVSGAAWERLTDPSAFVVRPEYYGETNEEFEAIYSDHLPVFVDYRATAVPEASTWVLLLTGLPVVAYLHRRTANGWR